MVNASSSAVRTCRITTDSFYRFLFHVRFCLFNWGRRVAKVHHFTSSSRNLHHATSQLDALSVIILKKTLWKRQWCRNDGNTPITFMTTNEMTIISLHAHKKIAIGRSQAITQDRLRTGSQPRPLRIIVFGRIFLDHWLIRYEQTIFTQPPTRKITRAFKKQSRNSNYDRSLRLFAFVSLSFYWMKAG